MLQNHLLQVLSLVAMEPPVVLDPEPIRDEKVKVLKSIRPIFPSDVAKNVVAWTIFCRDDRWQIRTGLSAEARLRVDSNVETYVAVKL